MLDGSQATVHYNQSPKANLLKTIRNPLGGSIDLDYERVGNKYGYKERVIFSHQYEPYQEEEDIFWDMPNSKWVLSEVHAHDGLDLSTFEDGEDVLSTYYAYDGGIYSRREREFLGFTRTRVSSAEYIEDFHGGDDQKPEALQELDKITKHEITDYFLVSSEVNVQHRFQQEYLKGLPIRSYSLLEFDDAITPGDETTEYNKSWLTLAVNNYNYKYYYWNQTGSNEGEINYSTEVDWNTISEAATVFVKMTDSESISFIDNSSYFYSTKLEYAYDEFGNIIEVSRNSNTTYGERSLDWVGTYTTDDDPPKTYDLYRWSYSANYTVDIIALMDYFNPINASGQTSVLQRHRVYVGSLNFGDLRRESIIDALGGANGSTAEKYAPTSVSRHYEEWDVDNSVAGNALKSTTTIDYDKWGNAITINLPHNVENDKLKISVTYDSDEHTYATEIEHLYTNNGVAGTPEVSRFRHDPTTGLLAKKIDANGHPMEFFYDGFHRPEFVYGPREIEGGPPTVRHYYFDESELASGLGVTALPWAITEQYIGNAPTDAELGNWKTTSDYTGANTTNILVNEATPPSRAYEPDPQDPNYLRSSVLLDGQGRVVQTKSEVSSYNGSANVKSVIHSGWVKYDQWATARVAYNFVETTGGYNSIDQLKTLIFEENPEMMSFKYLNRYGRVFETHERNATASEGFTVSTQDVSWVMDGTERVIEQYSTFYGTPVSHSRSFINAEGQAYKVEQGDGITWTKTEYQQDAMGHLLSVQDPKGETTSYTYDRLGRPIEEVHPDKGTMGTNYDAAGNITTITVNPLSANSFESEINFEYCYNRLEHKTFVGDSQMDVHITYGTQANNAVGRPVKVEVGALTGQKSLIDEYAYDELGQTVREKRTIAVPRAGEYTFKTDYVYDSWGRLRHMRYPDGEKLQYHYTSAGDLERISTSEIFLADYPSDYLHEIQYEGDGRRGKVLHGNGAVTDYTYNPTGLRMLNSFKLTSSDNNALGSTAELSNTSYEYNASGNISKITNIGPISGSLNVDGTGATFDNTGYFDIGGGSTQEFTYDAWNRLTEADGAWLGKFDVLTYDLDMSYNADGSIATRSQSVSQNGLSHGTLDYDLSYDAYHSGTHQVSTVTQSGVSGTKTYQFTFDNRGNLTERQETFGEQVSKSKYLWDQVDRMVAASEDNDAVIQHNVYDANGIRIMKGIAHYNALYENNEEEEDPYTTSPYIIYAAPHYVFQMFKDQVDVSKHYFGGGERISSRTQLEERYYQEPGHTPGTGPFFNQFDPDYTGGGSPSPQSPPLNNVVLKEWDDIATWLEKPGINYNSMVVIRLEAYYGSPLYTHPDCDDASYNLGSWNYEYCECRNNPVEAEAAGINCPDDYPHIFWYHVNHLGSTEYVTDLAGQEYEHFFYLPFGEVAIQQHVNTDGFSSPYQFTAAERDVEIGLSYMGARYYDAKFAMWLSADPLSHEREWLTPYHYVTNNPIMFVDPTGLQEVSLYAGPDNLASVLWNSIFKTMGIKGDLDSWSLDGDVLDPVNVSASRLPRSNTTTQNCIPVNSILKNQSISGVNRPYLPNNFFDEGYSPKTSLSHLDELNSRILRIQNTRRVRELAEQMGQEYPTNGPMSHEQLEGLLFQVEPLVAIGQIPVGTVSELFDYATRNSVQIPSWSRFNSASKFTRTRALIITWETPMSRSFYKGVVRLSRALGAIGVGISILHASRNAREGNTNEAMLSFTDAGAGVIMYFGPIGFAIGAGWTLLRLSGNQFFDSSIKPAPNAIRQDQVVLPGPLIR